MTNAILQQLIKSIVQLSMDLVNHNRAVHWAGTNRGANVDLLRKKVREAKTLIETFPNNGTQQQIDEWERQTKDFLIWLKLRV